MILMKFKSDFQTNAPRLPGESAGTPLAGRLPRSLSLFSQRSTDCASPGAAGPVRFQLAVYFRKKKELPNTKRRNELRFLDIFAYFEIGPT